jgi:hypothetical protein
MTTENENTVPQEEVAQEEKVFTKRISAIEVAEQFIKHNLTVDTSCFHSPNRNDGTIHACGIGGYYHEQYMAQPVTVVTSWYDEVEHEERKLDLSEIAYEELGREYVDAFSKGFQRPYEGQHDWNTGPRYDWQEPFNQRQLDGYNDGKAAYELVTRPRIKPQEVQNAMTEHSLKPTGSSFYHTDDDNNRCACGIGAVFFNEAGYGNDSHASYLAEGKYGEDYVHGYNNGFNHHWNISDQPSDEEKLGFLDGRAAWALVKDFVPAPPVTDVPVTDVEDDLHGISTDDDNDSDHYDDSGSDDEPVYDDSPDEDLSDFNDY